MPHFNCYYCIYLKILYIVLVIVKETQEQVQLVQGRYKKCLNFPLCTTVVDLKENSQDVVKV